MKQIQEFRKNKCDEGCRRIKKEKKKRKTLPGAGAT